MNPPYICPRCGGDALAGRTPADLADIAALEVTTPDLRKRLWCLRCRDRFRKLEALGIDLP